MEQLAAISDISVDTVRYYQSRGSAPAARTRRARGLVRPRTRRADRARSASLQRKGLTLAAIRRVVSGELGVADADLAAAVAAARTESGEPATELLDLDAFSARSGVPASLIQAVEREGIRLGRTVDGEERYTAADIELVRTALRLLEFGLPLADLLALARDADRGDARARRACRRAVR